MTSWCAREATQKFPQLGSLLSLRCIIRDNITPSAVITFGTTIGAPRVFANALALTVAGYKKTRDVYDTDAMPVGKCNEGESVDKCSAGGNAFGDLSKRYCWAFCWFGEGNCRKGQKIGAKVVCTAKARNL